MVKGGRNPKVKGKYNEKYGTYNQPNKEGNRNNVAQCSGNIAPRERGQEGRGMGRGGHANTGQGGRINRVLNLTKVYWRLEP